MKANNKRKVRKENEEEKRKVVSGDKNEVGVDTPNHNLDMRIDNRKKKSAQEQEEKNLDLIMDNNSWVASPTPSTFKFVFDIVDKSRNHIPDNA